MSRGSAGTGGGDRGSKGGQEIGEKEGPARVVEEFLQRGHVEHREARLGPVQSLT